MDIVQKIRKPYMRKLAIWFMIVAVLGAICYFYHASPTARFEPIVSVVLLLFVSVFLLSSFGLIKYFFDKSFSGVIVDLKPEIRYYKESAFDKKITTRTFVGMTIECDNGKRIFFEQMLPDHLTKKIPYRINDRVYHIKGAKNLCRFPRNDTDKEYEPVSVICPICGAILSLGSKACSFCGSELPFDPIVK